MQNKVIRLNIESEDNTIIDSLNNRCDSFAPLEKVSLEIQGISEITKSGNDDHLDLFLLTGKDSLSALQDRVTAEREMYAYTEINSRIKPSLKLLRSCKWDKNILDFYLIGGQRQYFEQEDYNYLNDKYYDLLSVGTIKSEITEVEPFLRDTHLLRMSFNALRYGDFPAKTDFNPSGFHAEEFIRFARYAGLSPRLNTIAFQDIDMRKLKDSKSCQELLIQMMWYIGEGFHHRGKEDPDASTNEIFVFDLEDPEVQINFIRSDRSGRWWYRFEDSEGVEHTFSCNFTDFESLQNKTVSARIKSAILRYL